MKKLIYYSASTLVMLFMSISFNACNDPCNGVECNGGTCLDAKCDCPDNYVGENCEIFIDPCKNVYCQNGGTCNDGDCDCPLGYAGTNCQTQLDPCENYPCVNGNRVSDNSNFTCNCDCYPGYIGDDCSQTDPNYSPMHGSYYTQQSCGNVGNQNYTMTISAGTAPPQAVINNLFANGANLNCNISGNQLTIPSQQVNALGKSGTVLGTGTLNGNTLTLTYRLIHSNGVIYCSATCYK